MGWFFIYLWIVDLLLFFSCISCTKSNNRHLSIHKRINQRALREDQTRFSEIEKPSSLPKALPEQRCRCAYCKRATSVCICNILPEEPLKTSVKIIILQHPNEIKKGLTSSVPLVKFCHNDTVIIRGVTFESNGNVSRSFGRSSKKHSSSWWLSPFHHEELAEAFADLENNPPLLLFPSDDAIDLDDCQELKHRYKRRVASKACICGNNNMHNVNECSVKNSGRKTTLIVIDGTWVEAKRICRRSPTIIRDSISVKFVSPTESIINDIRRGNKDNFLSSLEAIALAMTKIDTSAESYECSAIMTRALATVVEKQLQAWGRT